QITPERASQLLAEKRAQGPAPKRTARSSARPAAKGAAAEGAVKKSAPRKPAAAGSAGAGTKG
ncbi:MAG: hypothetical protein ACOC84_09480, partial [Actinomycetota bacterium]